MIKGVFMIHPNMGTMLKFILLVAQSFLQQMLQEVEQTLFNAFTLDSDILNNDSFVVVATIRFCCVRLMM